MNLKSGKIVNAVKSTSNSKLGEIPSGRQGRKSHVITLDHFDDDDDLGRSASFFFLILFLSFTNYSTHILIYFHLETPIFAVENSGSSRVSPIAAVEEREEYGDLRGQGEQQRKALQTPTTCAVATGAKTPSTCAVATGTMSSKAARPVLKRNQEVTNSEETPSDAETVFSDMGKADKVNRPLNEELLVGSIDALSSDLVLQMSASPDMEKWNPSDAAEVVRKETQPQRTSLPDYEYGTNRNISTPYIGHDELSVPDGLADYTQLDSLPAGLHNVIADDEGPACRLGASSGVVRAGKRPPQPGTLEDSRLAAGEAERSITPDYLDLGDKMGVSVPVHGRRRTSSTAGWAHQGEDPQEAPQGNIGSSSRN